MVDETTGPLDEEQKQELIRKIKECDTAEREIANAKAAGIPIGNAEKDLRDLRAKLMKIKQVYAPNVPLL